MKIYFCVQFTGTVLDIVVFVKLNFNLCFTLFFSFFKSKSKTPGFVKKKVVMAIPGVLHGSVRSPSWLCQESIIALKEVRQGGLAL